MDRVLPARFLAEPAVCGDSREQALHTLAELEVITLPPANLHGRVV